MSLSIQETVRQLVGTGLLKRDQADDVLGTQPRTLDEMLQLMERRQYLTSYQSGRIKRGELRELVLGRYKLLYRNASGSFARVFRAASLIDDNVVALKLLRARWAKDPNAVRNFQREAEVCMRFQHPNIVPIHEVGEDNGRYFFTMDFIEGGNLRDFIRIRKQLSPVEGAKCMLDVCRGLEYALEMGATHRDLKMTNVLMSSQGVAMLVDFGLAGDNVWSGRIGGDAEQRALEYASLEKGSNAPRNDPRSDIFFAGAIFYELITGEPAWPRTRDREERRQFSRYVNVRPLRQVDPSIPTSIARIVTQMMEVSPGGRYQRPAEVVRDLEEALQEIGERSAKVEPPSRRPANGSPEVANGQAATSGTKSASPTILCVEDRPKHQKIIREYFKYRGYQVLMMADYSRAIARMKAKSPPDCLVLMGKHLERSVVDIVAEAESMERETRVPALVVLTKELADELEQEQPIVDWRRVLVQPVNLKRLRLTIDKALDRTPV